MPEYRFDKEIQLESFILTTHEKLLLPPDLHFNVCCLSGYHATSLRPSTASSGWKVDNVRSKVIPIIEGGKKCTERCDDWSTEHTA